MDVEDSLYNAFTEVCQDEQYKVNFKQATGHGLVDDNECYEELLKWMGTEWIARQIDDIVWAMEGNP